MNINRYNYETFFLMYVDNELSAIEKKEVDFFIKQNPDLAKELKLLQQSILKPGEIIFTEKASLIKEEFLTAFQEKLFLNLDNELEANEKKRLDEMIANDTELTKEWNLLLQIKSAPDTSVIFVNKESLYKKNLTRIVKFDWLKIVAAAVLIGFGIWNGVTFYINKNKVQNTTTVIKNNTGLDKNIVIPNKLGVNQAAINTFSKNTNLAQQQIVVHHAAINITPIITIINKQNSNAKKQQNNIAVKKDNNKNKLSANIFNSNTSNKNDTSNLSIKILTDKIPGLQMDTLNKNTADEKLITLKNHLDATEANNVFASTTSFKENKDENSNDDHILYMPEKKLQQTKLGGIFNKIKQAIKNKTKAGIRIANVEIAIR